MTDPSGNVTTDHETDMASVQEWLGQANIATTRLYDRGRIGVYSSFALCRRTSVL